jgi:orotidine-5'-phosphate decarboxylase
MNPKINDVRDRLIVALDVPTVWDAYRLVSTLGDGVTFYKIGYRLAFAGGLDLARQLVAEGKKVFLDLKLHDIGNTVTEGVDSLTKLGVTFLTVHAYPQTMRGALGNELRHGEIVAGGSEIGIVVRSQNGDGEDAQA